MTQEPPPESNLPESAASSSDRRQTRSDSSPRRSRRRSAREAGAPPLTVRQRPFLIAQTVQILRSTIRSLETVANRLEMDPELAAPPADGIWQQILAVIRAFLPRAISRRVSNAVLTGTIVSLATLGVVVIVLPRWLPSQPVPTDIATLPTPEVTPTPSASPEIVPTATPEPVSEPTPTAEATPLGPPEPEPVDQEPEPTPSEAPLPEVEPPIAELPPVAEPEPPAPLTPEQQLLALIQTELTQLSEPYQSGLIQTVQPNYRSSRLVIRLHRQWQELNQSQQRELANKLLQQAKALNFSRLELTDEEGKMLARSPVVGTDMVILRRSLDSQTTV